MKALTGLAIACLLTLTACGGQTEDDAASASPTTTTAAPSEKAAPKPLAEQVSDEVEDAVESAKVKADGHSYDVTFEVADNLSMGLVHKGADKDALDIVAAIHDTDPRVGRVGIRGTFPVTDDYGNESQGQVYWALFKQSLGRINWSAVDTLDVEQVADQYEIHRDMQ